jgi:putative aldouronate transport system permease protein
VVAEHTLRHLPDLPHDRFEFHLIENLGLHVATIALFTTVFCWNEWFFGLIYSHSPRNYPLQSFLRTVIIDMSTFSVVTTGDYELIQVVSDRSQRAAQIFLAIIPIMMVYPFLQRYFITGIVMGSVKE